MDDFQRHFAMKEADRRRALRRRPDERLNRMLAEAQAAEAAGLSGSDWNEQLIGGAGSDQLHEGRSAARMRTPVNEVMQRHGARAERPEYPRRPVPAALNAPPGVSIDANIRRTRREREQAEMQATELRQAAKGVSGRLPLAAAALQASGLGVQHAPKVTWLKRIWPTSDWDYKRRGKGLQYEPFGNFNYGATGAAAGVPEGVALWGAGAAQYMNGGAADPRKFGTPLTGPPWGDDPRDRANIQRGYGYYRRKHPER